jgi:transglutaminase-like putative cysteine protease
VKIHIHHQTSYFYADKVTFGAHRLMLRPRESHGIRLESSRIDISPRHRIRWMRDLHENNIALVDFTESAAELVVECEFLLEVSQDNPFDFIIVPEAMEYPFNYEYQLRAELLPLSQNIYPRDIDRLRQWIDLFWRPGQRIGTLELLQELNSNIYRLFRYRRREQKGVQSPAETLENNSGSCRDFATLFMEACRYLGLAARFVSGYMYSSEITGRMSMHGWAEVYLPGAGWIGFDPSWGILAASQYVPVAVTRHPEHAPPISGTYIGTARTFLKTQVDLYVKRVEEPVELPARADETPADFLAQDGQSSERVTEPARLDPV